MSTDFLIFYGLVTIYGRMHLYIFSKLLADVRSKKNRQDGGTYNIKDPKDFATDHWATVLMGWVYDGSLVCKLRLPVFVFLLYTAPIHHMVPVFCDSTQTSEQKLMASSISMLYVLLCTIWPVMFYHSSTILDLEKTVRIGFFTYSEPFTTEERTILSKTNDFVIKSTRISILAYFCAGFGTFFKEMSPNSIRLYTPPYPGWFPWTINSNFRFAMALLYQCGICLNTTFALEGIFLLFAFHTIHFEGQLRLLKQHYEDTFPRGLPTFVTHSREYKEQTMRRLKECIQHHLVIQGFHKATLNYFGICLLVYRVVCTIMLCILCYLTTTGIALNKFMQLLCFALALMFLCFIFCLKGEQVAKMGDVWRLTIYEVDWWNQPVEVQKTVRMMIMGASKPFQVYGIWKPAMFSHEGIAVNYTAFNGAASPSELIFAYIVLLHFPSLIGQETFSFFNMLRAMK